LAVEEATFAARYDETALEELVFRSDAPIDAPNC
jgi:hypothetical protein